MLLLFSCSSSNDETPSYVGQYYFIKNYAIVNGVKGEEYNGEGTCIGKSNYNIKANHDVIFEGWAPDNYNGGCRLFGTANYTYDQNNRTIDGDDAKFEGNLLIITNISKGPSTTTENIYYYKKK